MCVHEQTNIYFVICVKLQSSTPFPSLIFPIKKYLHRRTINIIPNTNIGPSLLIFERRPDPCNFPCNHQMIMDHAKDSVLKHSKKVKSAECER